MSDKHSYLHELRRRWAAYFVNPITDVLEKMHVHPNMITILGVLISIGGAVLLAFGYLRIAGGVIAVGAIMDLFDGSLARKRNMVSMLGAMLDAVFDRLQEAVVLFGLLIFFLVTADGTRGVPEAIAPAILPIILIFIAFFSSFMISYLRARAEGYGITGTSGLVTRPERVIITIILLLLNLPVILAWVLAIATTVGVLLRAMSVIRRIRRGERGERANPEKSK